MEEYLKTLPWVESQIVFVNDWSTDNTKSVLEEIKAEGEIPVSIVDYGVNKGKWYAVKQWVESVQADYYLIMDADGATDMRELKKFLYLWEKYDMVIGSRTSEKAERVWYKKVAWYVSHMIITKTLGLSVKDTQCGFKLFSDRVKHVWQEMVLERWWFDFELLYLMKKYGYSVREEEVVWEEKEGSKVRAMDYVKTLKELYIVRKTHSNNTVARYGWNTAIASIAAVFVWMSMFVNAGIGRWWPVWSGYEWSTYGLPFFAAGVLPASTNASGSVIATTASIASTSVQLSTTRVNVSTAWDQDNGWQQSYEAVASTDGRYVVFVTDGALDPNDTNGTDDIYMRDTVLWTTTLVSRWYENGNGSGNWSWNGSGNGTSGWWVVAANGMSVRPQISADGRYVVYESLANNLVSDDTNRQWDIFVPDNFHQNTF